MPDTKKPWVVEVDLLNGEDFRTGFDTREEAVSAVQTSIDNGYFARDLVDAPNKYDMAFYPMGQVKAVRIHDRSSE